MTGDRTCPPLRGDVAPSAARGYLRDLGARWTTDVLESVLLATSELVTNARVHGGVPVTLAVRTTAETVRVEVHDTGRVPAGWSTARGAHGSASRARPDGDLGLGGRGLGIVDTLSTAWGVTPQPPGKVVWFELSLRRDDGRV